MALVYLARQTDLDRFVALEGSARSTSDASFAQRFLREVPKVAGSLSHPNIVTVHDYFEARGRINTSRWSTSRARRSPRKFIRINQRRRLLEYLVQPAAEG